MTISLLLVGVAIGVALVAPTLVGQLNSDMIKSAMDCSKYYS